MPPDPSDEPIESPEADGAPAEGTTEFAPTPRRSASSLSHFLELRLHARGGLGEVYEAWNAEFRRPVALKFLKPEKSDDGESRARFRGEAEITGRLEHPGIVPIYGMGEDDAGHPCYAMRFIRGLPMDDAIRGLHDADAEPSARDGRLADLLARIKGTRRDPAASDDLRDRAFRELLGRFKSVCETVAYAHSKRVLHRDLKPQNVMLGKFGETLVVDWGLARTFDPSASAESDPGGDDAENTMPIDPTPGGLTPTVGPKGTPSYMSPEQATARHDIGPATDIYSLGATLYSLLAGRPPFRGRADEVLEQVRDGAFPPPRSVKPSVPRALEAVCLKAMARDPRGRYASAEALADDVDNWLNDRPVTALREPWTARAGRWTKRHRTAVTASAAALVVGLGIVSAFAWRSRGERIRVEADALASIDVAERLSADSLNDLAKWAAASSAAERAKGLLDSAGIAGDVRRRAEAALAVLRSQERDRKMLRDLEEARMAGAAGRQKGDEFDSAAQSEGYRRAFRAYGVDLEALRTDRAAVLVRGSSIRDGLVAAIDDFASLPGVAAPMGEKLLAIARAVDDDPVRGEIRDAAARKDRATLVKLARGMDVRTTKVGHLGSLSRSLRRFGGSAASRELCERAQEVYAEDFWINFELAWSYLHANPRRFDRSARFFSAAVALRPRSAAAHHYLAAALILNGDLVGGEASCRRAIALNPKNAAAYLTLGAVFSNRGDRAGAEAEFRRAVALEPNNPWAHMRVGDALGNRGDRAGAEAEFRRAVAIDPEIAEAHMSLGDALNNRGDRVGAEAEHRRAVALMPDHVEAHWSLGVVLRARGDRAGAEAEFRRAIALGPDSAEAHMHLGIALSERGDPAGAEASLRRAIALKPGYADPHVHLGNVFHGQGDLAGAEAEHRRALVLSPNLPWAHHDLGLVLRSRGDRAGAEAEFRRALARWPDYAQAHNNLGGILRDRGDLAGAEAEYRRAVALKPDYADVHCNLGLNLRKLGRISEALAAFRRGHELGSKQSNWGYPSAAWIRQCERLVALEPRLPKLLTGEDAPRDADEAVGLAELCYYTRRHGASARFYEKALADHPKLAIDLDRHRYNAACAAALAGAGRGEDAATLDDAARARWRARAIGWLRDDLAGWGKRLEGASPTVRANVQRVFIHWKADVDLAGLRDPEALARLPETEREECRKLWADVDALLKKAEARAK